MREFIFFVGFVGKRSHFLVSKLADNRLKILNFWAEVGDAVEIGRELVDGTCD